MKHILLFVTALVLAVYLVPGTPVHALSAQGLGIYPTYFDEARPLTKAWFLYDMEPGVVKEDFVSVSNYAEAAKTVLVYAVDSTINNKGGFALEQKPDTKDYVGGWVTFMMEGVPTTEVEITLEPGTNVMIPFTFRVPIDAPLEPGEYAGAIVMEEKREAISGGGMMIATRIGTRIYYTAPGIIEQKLSIQDLTATYNRTEDMYHVQAKIKNEGNITTFSTVALNTKQIAWGITADIQDSELRIPPKSTREVDFYFPNPQWGKHAFALGLQYTDQDEERRHLESATMTFWAVPWVLIAWASIICGLNLAFFSMHKIAALLRKRNVRSYTVQRGDTIESVAKRFSMRWRILAKINHLKRPYTLKTKQKLLVKPKHSIKGTQKVPLHPARIWAYVSILSVVLMASLVVGVWGGSQVANPALLKASILDKWF